MDRCGPAAVCQLGVAGDACSSNAHCADQFQCTSAGICAVFTYDPLNVGVRAHRQTFPKVGLTCNTLTTDSDTGESFCGSNSLESFLVKQESQASPSIQVFMVHSLTLPAGSRWNVRGKRPTLLLAADFVRIEGDVVVEPSSKTLTNTCSVRVQGAPLVGGSNGQNAFGEQGRGGGALQISAARRLELGALATIGADGASGTSANVGGGNGGTIVLEAVSVTLSGQMHVNGAEGTGGVGTQPIRGNLGAIRVHSGTGQAVGAPTASTCSVQATLHAFTAPPPLMCGSVPTPSNSCDLCKAELCCMERAMCQAQETCNACLNTSQSASSMACASNILWQQYSTCVTNWCLKCTP